GAAIHRDRANGLSGDGEGGGGPEARGVVVYVDRVDIDIAVVVVIETEVVPAGEQRLCADGGDANAFARGGERGGGPAAGVAVVDVERFVRVKDDLAADEPSLGRAGLGKLGGGPAPGLAVVDVNRFASLVVVVVAGVSAREDGLVTDGDGRDV